MKHAMKTLGKFVGALLRMDKDVHKKPPVPTKGFGEEVCNEV